MQVIVSHVNLDFDGLGAMVAAQKLYPRATMVVAEKLSQSVQDFLSLYKDTLDIIHDSFIDQKRLKRLIVVDVNDRKRLGKLSYLATLAGVEIHLYDHHPPGPDTIDAKQAWVEQVGATTTLLVERIREHAIPVNPFEATIMALGIYQDTGSLSFINTTARDAAAVTFLLEQGANLGVVTQFLDRPLTTEQQDLLQELLHAAEDCWYDGTSVTVAAASVNDYVPGLSMLAHKLASITGSHAVFLVIQMAKKIFIVGRSATDTLEVNRIMTGFGGGGHSKAASAVVKGEDVHGIVVRLKELIEANVATAPTAEKLMSVPVKTVTPETSIADAGKVMLRYGHSGLPVVKDHRLLGIISRRDVDKAQHHGLGHAPVKGYMSRNVVTIGLDTPLPEIQRLMITHDIGRLPVVENGILQGIVSRSDVLRVLHGEHYPHRFRTMYQKECPLACPLDTRKILETSLPYPLLSILKQAGRIGQALGYPVYLVGGLVRDLILSRKNEDIDLVVVGDGIVFADRFARHFGGKVTRHKKFATATVSLPQGVKIDVATARREYYDYPAALPTVEPSNLKEDLYRRDFTINAMALSLSEDHFGQLIDYFCGYNDLINGTVRVLYNLSFVEDPTRILRAVRFEQRYGFTMDSQTFDLAKEAVDAGRLEQVSLPRLGAEFLLILKEPKPLPALKRLDALGAFSHLLGQGVPTQDNWSLLEGVRAIVGEAAERGITGFQPWLIYLAGLVDGWPERMNRLQAFDIGKKELRIVEACISGEVKASLFAKAQEGLAPVHRRLRHVPVEPILYAVARCGDHRLKVYALDYLIRRQTLKLNVDGHDIQELGYTFGPLIGEVLLQLECAHLNGTVHDRRSELEYVRGFMAERE